MKLARARVASGDTANTVVRRAQVISERALQATSYELSWIQRATNANSNLVWFWEGWE
jgi:hypothetical protein